MVTNSYSLNETLRAIITTLLALPPNYVRPANQNAPTHSINDAFMTVLIRTEMREGTDRVTQTVDDVKGVLVQHIEGQRRVTASLQAFREDAFALLQRLALALASDYGVQLFQDANLGLITTRGPDDITQVVASMNEARAQMDLEFYAIAATDIDVPYFDTFPITVTVDQDGTASFEVKAP